MLHLCSQSKHIAIDTAIQVATAKTDMKRTHFDRAQATITEAMEMPTIVSWVIPKIGNMIGSIDRYIITWYYIVYKLQ